MARRLPQLALAALLTIAAAAPPVALAQATAPSGQVTVVKSVNHQATPYINIAECDGSSSVTLTYYWNVTGSTAGAAYDLFLYDTEISGQTTCPPKTNDTVTVHSIRVAPSVSALSYTDSTTVSARIKSLGDNVVSCTGSATQLYLCVTLSSDTTQQKQASGPLRLDLATGPVPTSVSAAGGDTVLHVSWANGTTGGGTTTGYRIYWGPSGQALTSSHETSGIGSTTYDITGLTNDASYDVQVTSLTTGGNESAKTAVVTGAPFLVDDFWKFYKANDGTETGGCAGGAGGLLALLALAPLALRARRRP